MFEQRPWVQMSPNFLDSSVQCTSWSVWNALALGGEEVIANNIWALKRELSKTEQESYFHSTRSFFFLQKMNYF